MKIDLTDWEHSALLDKATEEVELYEKLLAGKVDDDIREFYEALLGGWESIRDKLIKGD